MGEEREPLAVAIGNRIRLAREAARLSQAQIALRLSMGVSRYRSYELGDVLAPVGVLIELARILKRSACYFLGAADGKLSDEDRLLLDYFQRTHSLSLRESTLTVARLNFDHDQATRPQEAPRAQ